MALYNYFFLPILLAAFRCIALVNSKMRRSLTGKRALLAEVRTYYTKQNITKRRVLVHVASFGELEQAKTVIAGLKARGNVHIHLTFFSPSGYENTVEKYTDADLITYAPLDSRAQVADFLAIVKPDLALFARYDLWPNMAAALAELNVHSILFSATLGAESGRDVFFLRTLQKRIFQGLNKILTVGEGDRKAFLAMDVSNEKIGVTGDTRFDQVIARREQVGDARILPESLRAKIEQDGTFVFVAGSTWQKDENLLKSFVSGAIERKDNFLAIVVPHEPTPDHIAGLKATYKQNAILLSNIEHFSGERVIIVDSIGKLFGLYRQADLAYIGGGFGAGVHNVLEAAVWGVPTIVGPKHTRSQEVGELIAALGAFAVSNSREFAFVISRFLSDEDFCAQAGESAQAFVHRGAGATERILREIVL
jgi:3-deoxy-D-manno-octulosonic-acid transferase